MERYQDAGFTPESFSFSYEKQYHVLKHFSVIDDPYREHLAGETGHSNSDIRDRLHRFGSKFHPSFASNPLEVFRQIELSKGNELTYPCFTEERIELEVSFDRLHYPDGIGNDTLVEMDQEHPEHDILTRTRKGYDIHYGHGNPVPTWSLYCIFEKASDDWSMVTMFPGKYAPPFPDNEVQSPKQYEQNKEFWDRHMFLIEGE